MPGVNEYPMVIAGPMPQSPGDVAVNEQKCVCKDRGLEKGGDAE